MAPQCNSTPGLSMLYVEDDRATRKIMHAILTLELPAIPLYVAEDGEAGLTLYREHHPDIVLTDIDMPKMDGIRMANEIKLLNPEAVIIAMSACSETLHRLDAISDYLMNPLIAGNSLKQ